MDFGADKRYWYGNGVHHQPWWGSGGPTAHCLARPVQPHQHDHVRCGHAHVYTEGKTTGAQVPAPTSS
jgi:hypothetical protein